MSKATEIRSKIQAYILQAYILSVVDSSGFENCDYFTKCETRKEKISFLKSRFFSEYGWNIKQVGEQRALINWLQGLALDIEFYNVQIIELMDLWGLVKRNKNGDITEKQYDKTLDLYWHRLSMAILMMFKEIK